MICINRNINVQYCICNKRASTHRYHWKIITQSDNVKMQCLYRLFVLVILLQVLCNIT